MAQIYSTRFIGGRTTAGGSLTYVVPTGFVAVVRSISVDALGSGTTSWLVGLGTTAAVLAGTTLTAGVTVTWDGRQVFNAGDTIEVTAAGAAVAWMVSGYLLGL